VTKKDDWYTNSRWDDAARADFDAHIRRARKGYSRAGYFKVKARCLWAGGQGEPPRHDAALELLARGLVESGDEAGVEAELRKELAVFQLSAGDRAAGIASLKRSIAAPEFNPVWPKSGTQVLLARCLIEGGDYARAIRTSKKAYASASHRPRYAALERMQVVDHDGKPFAHPDDAAECVVIYHHAAEPDEPAVPEVTAGDRASIAALDRHFAIIEPQFRDPLRRPFHPATAYTGEFLAQHFVPEFGAFLGRVLVKTARGKWIVRAPLMKSRIKLGTRELNPFRAAFATAFYEIPLAVALEQIESKQPRFALP